MALDNHIFTDPMRVATLALFSNLAIGIAKIAGGRIHHSQALTADGLDSVGDSVADLTTIGVIFLSSQHRIQKFSLRPKIIEGFGTMIIGSMIVASGYSVGRDSLASRFPTQFGRLPINSGDGDDNLPSIQAAWYALVSIIIKQYLSAQMMMTAKKTNSSAIAAGSKHMLVDSYIGMLTLVAIAISRYVPAASGSDDICGFCMCIMVIKSGLEAFQSGITNVLQTKYEDSQKMDE